METAIDSKALTSLVEMLGGDEMFLVELLDLYFENSTRLFEAARLALAQNDADELRHAAHDLKSNSANFGAHRLAQLCRELEERARASDLTDAAERLAQIHAEYDRVQLELRAVHPHKQR